MSWLEKKLISENIITGKKLHFVQNFPVTVGFLLQRKKIQNIIAKSILAITELKQYLIDHYRAEAESASVREIVERELDSYPYTRKAKTVDPYFSPMDLMKINANVNFETAITDAGRKQFNRLGIWFSGCFSGNLEHHSIGRIAECIDCSNFLVILGESLQRYPWIWPIKCYWISIQEYVKSIMGSLFTPQSRTVQETFS